MGALASHMGDDFLLDLKQNALMSHMARACPVASAASGDLLANTEDVDCGGGWGVALRGPTKTTSTIAPISSSAS